MCAPAQHGAVQHDGALEGALLCHVLQVEPNRELHTQMYIIRAQEPGSDLLDNAISRADSSMEQTMHISNTLPPPSPPVPHLEVELHGGALELAFERVKDRDIDLGAVEGAVAGVQLQR